MERLKASGVKPLPSRLHLTTYLALASLIFGNALSWVHVGCHAAGGGCTHTSKGLSESLGIAERAHKCCHHSDNPIDHRMGVELQKGQSKPIQQGERQPVGAEHDSEDCFVCQNVFALRHGLITNDVPFVWEPEITQRQPVCVSSALPGALFLSGLSLRGPPQA